MMSPWGKLECLSQQECRELQNKKLQQFINHYVYPFSPYYRRLFDENKIDPKSIKSKEDLKRIPLTSKMDFIDKPEQPKRFRDFILQPDKEKIRKNWPVAKLIPLAFNKLTRGEQYIQENLAREFRPVFMTFTTGTTNKPVPFVYSNYDIQNLYVSGARMLSVFGIKQEEIVVNMFPYAPHLAFWQVVFGGFASNALILSTGGGRVLGTEGNINAILNMKPSVILGVPTYIYHVLREAQEKGIQFSFIKKVILGASRVTQGFKIKLAEILESMGAADAEIFGTYGFTESRCAWGECPTARDISSGYHLYPDKEIFEVIDPKTGEVKGDGQDGEIVYTALDSRGSAVIRYRTGDFVTGGITTEPCPYCKSRVPRLSSDITRLSDIKDLQLSKIKGSLVNLSHFEAVMSDVPGIDEWQIELRKKNNDPYDVDELVIYLSMKDHVKDAGVVEDVKEKVLSATEVRPNDVLIISREEMVKRLCIETQNKEKRVLDIRPKL